MNGVLDDAADITANEYNGKTERVFFYFNADRKHLAYGGRMQQGDKAAIPVTIASAAPMMPNEGLVAKTKIRPVLTAAPIKLFIMAAPAKLRACSTA